MCTVLLSIACTCRGDWICSNCTHSERSGLRPVVIFAVYVLCSAGRGSGSTVSSCCESRVRARALVECVSRDSRRVESQSVWRSTRG